MTTSSSTDIQQLKEFIGDRFNELKLEVKEEINTLGLKVESVKEDIGDVKGDIKGLSEKVAGIDKRLSNVETSIQKIPELAEKTGELKNWKQVGLVLITAAVSSIFSGTIGGVIGWLLRAGRA